MRVHALRIEHGTKELLFVALTAEFLGDEYRVRADIHTPSNKDGYQREPTPKRFREIGEYIAGNDEVSSATGPVMSQSLVLNSRTHLKHRRWIVRVKRL